MVEKIQLAVRMRPELKEGLRRLFPEDNLPTIFERLIYNYVVLNKNELQNHLYNPRGQYATLKALEEVDARQGISKEFINQVKATGDAMEARLSMLDEILQDCFATGLASEDEDKEGDFAQPWRDNMKNRQREREASNA